MTTLALSEIIGLPVYDAAGRVGRVRELAVVPQEDPTRVSALVVRTADGVCGEEPRRDGEELMSKLIAELNEALRNAPANAHFGELAMRRSASEA